MISIKRKEDFKRLLEKLIHIEFWNEEEMSVPVTQTFLFTQLIMLISDFEEIEDKKMYAFEIFGTMCRYMGKSYSIKPVIDLLSALEKGEKKIKKPKNLGFMVQLIINTQKRGFGHCTTLSLTPFLQWFKVCGTSLKELREELVKDIERQEQVDEIPALTDNIDDDEKASD